jgi:protein TonB
MKLVLAIFFILFTGVANAQETVRKVNRLANGDKEEFYVLKSDHKILHGNYEKTGSFSRVTGTYNNGLKEGAWTEFSTGTRLRSVGDYSKNERVGIWKFYDLEGELEQEFNFSTNELIYDRMLESMKARKFKVIKGDDTLLAFLERPPVYITGKTKMQSALTKGKGPVLALLFRVGGASGNVVVSFVIDTTGKAKDYKIVKGINEVCDTQALQMVKQLPNRWLPAKLNGELVEVEHTISIAFKNMSQ